MIVARRRLLWGLCIGAVLPSWPALGQQDGLARVGLLWIRQDPANLAALKEGLKALGYVDGRNIQYDERFLVDGYEALPDAAARLVGARPAVIVIYGSTALEAVRKLTSTIPIVVISAGNVANLGVVASLARPGGNITGTTFVPEGLIAKRLEMLREIVPGARRVAVVMFSGSPGEMAALKNLQEAAQSLGLELRVVEVRSRNDITPAVSSIGRGQADGIVFMGATLFNANRKLVIDATNKTGLPAIYSNASYVEAGGLIAYGTNISHGFRYVARYVDKILRGANPGELPIEQPTNFELAVNLKAAKAQGIVIPGPLLLRADRVVE